MSIRFYKLSWNFRRPSGPGAHGSAFWWKDNEGDIFKPETLEKIIKIDEEVAGLEETFRALTYSIGSRSAQTFQVTGTGEIGFESLMFPNAPQHPEGLERTQEACFIPTRTCAKSSLRAEMQCSFRQNLSLGLTFRSLKIYFKVWWLKSN